MGEWSPVGGNGGSLPAGLASQTTVGSFGIVIGSAAYPATGRRRPSGVSGAFA